MALENKGAEEADELRLENQRLREQLAGRDELLSVVAHELRNPLSPVYLQAQYIRDFTSKHSTELRPEWLSTQMNDLVRRLDRYLKILNKILEVSRINSGRVDIQPEPVELSAVVTMLVEDFKREAELAGSQVSVEHQPVEGFWDRARLEQIVSNLLSNAIRYGAGKPIQIKVYNQGELAILRIQDFGIGIEDHAKSRIFERFERAAPQLRNGGFGVGLWIVKKLCDAMNAQITVESRLNEGTIFTIELPKQGNKESE